MAGEVVRLHISPLNPELLLAVLGQNLSKFAHTASFHSLQTFPEKGYGYIEIPKMEAEKIKKKLNGAILKGQKLKVEEARPKKRQHQEIEGIENNATVMADQAVHTGSKRSKGDIDVLPGHALSPDRKVKRGWTEKKSEQSRKKEDKKQRTGKQAKLQAPSKYTEKEELLFKTKIPANKQDSKSTKSKSKKIKSKDAADVVHEFENTNMIPSFLRDNKSADSKAAIEYKDGEGWVAEDGDVVEEESSKASKRRKAAKIGLEIDVVKAQTLHKRPVQEKPLSPPDSASTSGGSSSSSSNESDTGDEEGDGQMPNGRSTSPIDYTSSSGSSTSSESETDEDDEIDTARTSPPAQFDKQSSPAPIETSVHPLEALFKKPLVPPTSIPSTQPSSSSRTPPRSSTTPKPTLELNTAFSFFNDGMNNDDIDDGDEHDANSTITNRVDHNLPTMPMTPFSTQDFRRRTIRSAAPTPDTADPRLSLGYGSYMLGLGTSDDDDDDDDGDDDNVANQGNVDKGGFNDDNQNKYNILPGVDEEGNGEVGTSQPISEFEKRFWEKRGENNRAWKARRRAVLKEKRQKENRSRRPKGAW